MSGIFYAQRSASFGLNSLNRFKRHLTVTLLCSTCLVPIATAETEISDDLTSGVATSTVADGAADDVLIASGGSIDVEEMDGFIAVTVDSDNSVTNEGNISIADSDNAVGIMIETDHTGDIANNGTIYLLEDYTREDEDDDDDLDGPFALGTNRTGFLLQSGGTHTGRISSGDGSTIQIEGNESAGISLLSALDGDVALDGSIVVTGDDSVGLEAMEDISGNVLTSGAITVHGENAIGVDLQGDIGGAVTFESAITSYGFASTSATNYVLPSAVDEDTPAVEDRLDADALLDNSAGVIIGGSVANGVLFNGAVDDFISEEDADDETKDTVDDFDENRSTASISSFGSGPAVLISADADGEADGDLVLGTVVETVRDTTDDDDDDDVTETLAVFGYDYGLINRGSIAASGLNVGFEATGLRIEGEQSGDGQTIVEGGIFNSGSISATAFEADATAVSIGEGATTPVMINDGTIQAIGYTQNGNDVVAVDISEGASVPEFTNTGTIGAAVTGETGNAIGVRDASGTLTSFTNNGTISISQSTDGETVTSYGDTLALDFSANTSGVNLLQAYEEPVDDTNGDDVIDYFDVTSPSITGDILFGAGDDSFILETGDVAGNVDFGTGSSVFDITDGDIAGNVTFRDGVQTMSVSGSALSGSLFFRDSTGSLTMADGSDFNGWLQTNNSLISLAIADSDVTFRAGTRATLSDFTVTGDSDLVFVINPNNTANSMLSVSGDTYIGSGVSIAPYLTSLPDQLTSQTIISSGDLTFEGSLDDVLLTNVPWMYNTSLSVTEGDTDTLDLSFALKSTDELGLDSNESAAFESLLEIFAENDDLGAGVSALVTENDFNQFYDLLLPQRTDASTAFVGASLTAALDALDDTLALAEEQRASGTRVWAQEYFVNLDQDSTAAGPGYNGDGFGASLGVDRAMAGIDAVGLFLNFHSGDFEEKTGGDNPVTTTSVGGGLYAADSLGPVDLRVAGLLSRLNFISHREIETPNGDNYETEGEWNGWSAALSASASSEIDLGLIFLRPQLDVDWLTLSQDAYTETGGGDLLNASIRAVDTDRLTASAILGIGTDFNVSGGTFRAEIEGGVRNRLSSTPFSTEVSYLGSDQSFTLAAEEDASEAAVFGISLTGGNENTLLNFGYNIETSDAGTTHYTGATVRIQF